MYTHITSRIFRGHEYVSLRNYNQIQGSDWKTYTVRWGLLLPHMHEAWALSIVIVLFYMVPTPHNVIDLVQ